MILNTTDTETYIDLQKIVCNAVKRVEKLQEDDSHGTISPRNFLLVSSTCTFERILMILY